LATLSVARLNKARHKQGMISKQNEKSRNQRVREIENAKPITEEEHQERIQKLKEIGLIK